MKKHEIAAFVAACFVVLLLMCSVLVLFTGCSASQQKKALAAHNAACEPTLLLVEQLTQVASKHGVPATLAAQLICGAPEAATKVVEAMGKSCSAESK